MADKAANQAMDSGVSYTAHGNEDSTALAEIREWLVNDISHWISSSIGVHPQLASPKISTSTGSKYRVKISPPFALASASAAFVQMAQPSIAAPLSLPSPSPATPTEQILFHVRFIDQWRASRSSQSTRFSFFGLELALQGKHGASPVSSTMDFSSGSRASQQDALREITGPFTVVVLAKMPLEEANDQQKALLQLTVPVQVQNQLARVNKIHFLKSCVSGADVYRELARVLDMVSVARPCELTFLRHNHAQAAAKIRPFAARADVQNAQVAQFVKLQEEEAKWPEERRKRKQFVLQQLDFYREQYLYDYIGGRLQTLHEEIMGGGQWHAYEFEKALWYYHAPTSELFAEHPMRNNEKTRELIGSVQLRTRMAAQKLQHGTRLFLRRNRLMNAATERILETIVSEIWISSVDTACKQEAAARAQAATKKLQTATAKTGKVRGLLGKFMPRKVVTSEAIEESTPPQEPLQPVLEPAPVEAVEDPISPPVEVERAKSPVIVPVIESEEIKVLVDPKPEPALVRAEKGPETQPACSDMIDPPASVLPTQDTAALRPTSALKFIPEPIIAVAVPPPEPQLREESEWCEPEVPVPVVTAVPQPLPSFTSLDPIAATVDERESALNDLPASLYDDDDDEDLVTNWRSRLRLLKAHYHERRVSPKKGKVQAPGPHSTVIVGHGSRSFSTTIEPALHDRSASLLRDLATDGPVSPGLLVSLKEPKQRSESDNYRMEPPTWRRDGSFRSFHEFFTGFTSLEARSSYPSGNVRHLIANRYDYDDEREAVAAKSPPASSKLPKLGPPAPLVAQPPPAAISKQRGTDVLVSVGRANVNGEVYGPSATIMQSSPPKKLPYIRRRKR